MAMVDRNRVVFLGRQRSDYDLQANTRSFIYRPKRCLSATLDVEKPISTFSFRKIAVRFPKSHSPTTRPRSACPPGYLSAQRATTATYETSVVGVSTMFNMITILFLLALVMYAFGQDQPTICFWDPVIEVEAGAPLSARYHQDQAPTY